MACFILTHHHPNIENWPMIDHHNNGELLVDESQPGGAHSSYEIKFTPSISYQVHSWNDLRQWIQGYQKGARHFKVDIYYHIDYEHFIKSYGKLCTRSIRDISGGANGNRCLLLTHDPPKIGGPDNGMGYFDYIDLIETLADIRKRFPDSGSDRIYVALCLKYQKIMFNSNAGSGTYVVGTMKNPCKEPDNEWIILVDEMYQLFNSRNEKLGLNIEFILDESGTSGGTRFFSRKCLENKWQKWPYTYISARDPIEILKDPSSDGSGWVFSKKKDPYSRFKYLNQPLFNDYIARQLEKSPTHFLEEVQQVNYGRFNNLEESKFLWEPSDQEEIWRALEVYSKHPTKRGVLRFSSNIDPIQMEVFISKYSKYGRNEPIPNTEGAKSPRLINIDSINNILIIYEKSNNIFYSIYDYNSHKISPHMKIKDGNGNDLITTSSNAVVSMSGVKNNLKSFRLIILFENGTFNFYKFNQISDNLELVLDRSFKIGASQLLSFSFSHRSIFVASKNASTQSLVIQRYEIQKVEKVLELKLVENIVVPNNNLIEFEAMKRLTIHSLVPTVEDSLNSQDILLVICYSTEKNHIYSTYMTVSSQEKDNYQLPKPTKLLGVGDFPVISSFKTSHASLEKTFISIVWGEGFCNNGDEHNLQRFPYTCSLERLSCPNVLQYSFISVQEFIQSIQQQPASSSVVASKSSSSAEIRMREMNKVVVNENTNNGQQLFNDYKYLFSPCKENMLFGCYDRGSHPSIVLFKHHGIHNTISAMTIHVGMVNNNKPPTTTTTTTNSASSSSPAAAGGNGNNNMNSTTTTETVQQQQHTNQRKINSVVAATIGKEQPQKYGESYTLANADDSFSSCASCGEALPYDGLVLDELLFSAKYLK